MSRKGGRLPDFLIIGAMKAGTTTLYNHLRRHPAVFMPAFKEPEFFVAEKSWHRGPAWYASLFADGSSHTVVGEASTSYTKCTEFEGVPARIKSVIPDVRLLYLLRHPLRRIESMYEHMLITGREKRPLDEAVLADQTYVGPSLYGRNLSLYLEHFEPRQILTLFTEDLAEDVPGSLRRVTGFLGVPEAPTSATRRDLESASRRTDRRLKSSLRKAAWAHRAYLAAPPRLRERANRTVTKPGGRSRATLSPNTINLLLPALLHDAQLLSQMTGAPVDRWSLSNPTHSEPSATSHRGS
jgi:hypothetical protein